MKVNLRIDSVNILGNIYSCLYSVKSFDSVYHSTLADHFGSAPWESEDEFRLLKTFPPIFSVASLNIVIPIPTPTQLQPLFTIKWLSAELSAVLCMVTFTNKPVVLYYQHQYVVTKSDFVQNYHWLLALSRRDVGEREWDSARTRRRSGEESLRAEGWDPLSPGHGRRRP